MSGTLISLLDTGPKGRFGTPTPRFPPVVAAATLAATALAWATATWAAEELEDNEVLTKPPPIPGGKTDGFFASGSPKKQSQ